MGQAAEDALDGTCCQVCGEWMGDVLGGSESPGFPRTCNSCDPREAFPWLAMPDTSPSMTPAHRAALSARNKRKRARRKANQAARRTAQPQDAPA